MHTYVFIDASNLFYGGEKLLGWKVDYRKLKDYLLRKYNSQEVLFYSGVFIRDYKYTINTEENFPLENIISFFEKKVLSGNHKEKKEIIKDLNKLYFYKKLKTFGYTLKLKPIKIIQSRKIQIMKANCDVDLTFDVIRNFNNINRLILMSGDGDFEILIHYFLQAGKEVIILSNPINTSRNIKVNFHKHFRSLQEIRNSIELKK
jgi:uncharacterized LabA/DUF88 family protein